MQFQYAQPSQVPLPSTVFAILNSATNALVCIAFDQQSAETLTAYNSAYTIAQGTLID